MPPGVVACGWMEATGDGWRPAAALDGFGDGDDAAGKIPEAAGWTPEAAEAIGDVAEAVAPAKGSVALPVGVVALVSGVVGFVIFVVFPFPLARLLATLLAMLETRASVLSSSFCLNLNAFFESPLSG